MRSHDILLAVALLAVACGTDDDSAPPGVETGGAGGASGAAGQTGTAATGAALTTLAADPQRIGDPDAGYHALVNENYVSCGIPWTAYSQAFGVAAPEDRIEGRDGRNAELPYHQTAITTPSGVEAVTANCLTCHAGRIDGQLVIGLGNAASDYTQPQVNLIGAAKYLLSDPKEVAELERFVARVSVLEGYTQTITAGVNPADNLAAILFSHRDRDTFEWKDPPLLEPPPQIVVPVDVPPWWNMKKKHAMFYVAAGRGDHARTMMAASTLCTDTAEEARSIDEYMPDIYAWLIALEPPKYPFAIDESMLETGEQVFTSSCSVCHGSYGKKSHYPNLLVALTEIGTDSTLALGASQFADRFVDWFNTGFYGEVSRLEPMEGYVAPPLDGVWATAPYFHNGSVPTLDLVLDSTRRPKFWTRSFDTTDYDQDAAGWRFTELDHGQDDEPSATVRRTLYDTTKLGYGNGGHTFGDGISQSERRALVEYLKTL